MADQNRNRTRKAKPSVMPACPTCRKDTQRAGNEFFPFCSERCKLVDLGRWVGEEYRIPVAEPPPPEPARPPPRSDDHD